MPTRATEREAGLGASAKQVAEHASALARLEIELAVLELKRKVAALALGIVFGLGAAVLLLYALGFGLAALAAGIATAIPVWAALLVVTGALVMLVALFGALALLSIKKGAPFAPKQAIREAKLTGEALRHDGNR